MARIMISDDSDTIRMVLKDVVEIGHHEVVAEAGDGIETVEKFNMIKPDILLLDVAMPRMDGESALKQIMATNPNAKVIMITATDNQHTIKECITAGALNYILKPFNFDDVLTAITKALEKH